MTINAHHGPAVREMCEGRKPRASEPPELEPEEGALGCKCHHQQTSGHNACEGVEENHDVPSTWALSSYFRLLSSHTGPQASYTPRDPRTSRLLKNLDPPDRVSPACCRPNQHLAETAIHQVGGSLVRSSRRLISAACCQLREWELRAVCTAETARIACMKNEDDVLCAVVERWDGCSAMVTSGHQIVPCQVTGRAGVSDWQQLA